MGPNQQQQAQQPHQLPTDVLAQVLQHVPLQQRFTDAALVCQQWAAAAGMATVSITHIPRTAASLAGMSAWLMQHGQQLESLEVSRSFNTGALQLQLPCAALLQLSKLRMSSHVLRLPRTVRKQATRRSRRGSSAAPAALLSKLVELHASSWDLSSTSAVMQLTSLSTLTCLSMHHITLSGGSYEKQPSKAVAQLSKAVSKVLQHLPLLQDLWLRAVKLDVSAFLPLASMQHLQKCNTECVSTGAGAVHSIWLLDHLPSSLTSLFLKGRRSVDAPTNSVPWTSLLRQLTGLQELSLDVVNFHAAMFANTPQARNLYFERCELLGGVEGAAALLAAVQQMQQLEVLSFTYGTLDGLSDVPAQQFSALTTSTRLRQLFLGTESSELFPVGAVAHMFPRGRRLPALSCVNFTCDDGKCMTGSDLHLLAEACPNLQSLGLRGVMQPGCSNVLLDLPPCINTLQLGDAFGDDAADVVCQLTQLEHLEATGYDSTTLTEAGLERLTALTRLTSLGVWGRCGLSEEVLGDWDQLVLEEQEGNPVWLQLREVCDESPVCAVARVKQLKEQNQQLQHRVAELEARVAQFEQGQQ